MEGPRFVLQERGQSGRSPLHTAACNGNLQQVTDQLQQGSKVNAPSRLPSDNGRQALHLAALGGHLNVVHELLNRGANPDTADNQGFRPLHIAAQHGFVDIVQRLHEANANLKTQTRAGWQAVHLAAGNGHVCVLKLLQDYHCNLAAPDSVLATPLHHAARKGQQNAVKWLIKTGVSLDVKDGNGMSAAELAKQNTHHAIYLDLTAAAEKSASKQKTWKKRHSQPDLVHLHPKPIREIRRPKLSGVPQECPSSPHLYRSITHPFISHNGAQMPHGTTPSTVRLDIPAEPLATSPPKNTPSQDLQSPQSPHVQPSHEGENSVPKSPPSQRLPPKSPQQQGSPIQSVQTPQSPHIPSHEVQTPVSPTLSKMGPYEFQDSFLHSSPVILESPEAPSFSRVSESNSSDSYPAATITSYSSTSSLSLSDLSPSPTTFPSTSPLLPEEGKQVKRGEKKAALLKFSKVLTLLPKATKTVLRRKSEDLQGSPVMKNEVRRYSEDITGRTATNTVFRRKSEDLQGSKATESDVRRTSQDVKEVIAIESDVRRTSQDVKEVIAGEGFSLGRDERDHPGESPPQAVDGFSLGRDERDHPGESPPQEAAFLDLEVQEAPRPLREGPDVYPCISNPRGIVVILNNKSFHDRPELTRYGSECDTKNLEDVFHKMGYEVRTRCDLTRQATLDWFLEVSQFPILQSVSCLFVFILSHGEGRKVFSTYDNETVSLDEVQSCFLNRSCPYLQGKPKVFFSHFCRGIDDETRSQYAADATREAYKDMICLYSSTEGFKALRSPRLGTPSVRALCLTLASYAHCKHFRDIIREFQKKYEKMEGATSPEVQDFKFKKEFYLNPIGGSRLY